MSNEILNGLERLVLAGIGAVATGYDKSKEIVDDLVKKGEITLEQGKVLNEELKHDIKSKVSENVVRPMEDFAVSSLIGNMDRLSADDLAKIKAKLQELEKKDSAETTGE